MASDTPSEKRPAPDVPAIARLQKWLDAEHTQEELEKKSGIPQQSISAYLKRVARPPSERRFLIQTHTNGAVLATDWETPDETRVRRAAERVAAKRDPTTHNGDGR